MRLAQCRTLRLSAQALRELDYPERLQKMLLTPQREVHVELIITRDRRGQPLTGLGEG